MRTFVNEHRPRLASRRTRANKETSTGRREPVKPALYDPQPESSSQSDNCDPHTPSPQYTEQIPHRPNGNSTHNELHTAIASDSIDPHFARLLNALVLGATNPKSDPFPPSPSAPSPIQPTDRPDTPTSALVDPADCETEDPTLPTSRSTSSANMGQQTPPIPASVPSVSPVNHRPAPSTHQSQHSLSSTSTSAPSRSSNMTDISPYLSKSAEVPTSAKRLKQLALLESVADESARLSPFLTHAPLPSASVPPMEYGPSVLYSSQSGRTGHAVPQFGHHERNFFDPFQVRPRTSQAFPFHRPGYAPASGQSMTQAELLSLVNQPIYPVPPHVSFQPPPHPYIAGLPSAPIPNELHARYPIHVSPMPLFDRPPPFPPQFTPWPAPPAAPRYGPADNQLLSILNGAPKT